MAFVQRQLESAPLPSELPILELQPEPKSARVLYSPLNDKAVKPDTPVEKKPAPKPPDVAPLDAVAPADVAAPISAREILQQLAEIAPSQEAAAKATSRAPAPAPAPTPAPAPAPAPASTTAPPPRPAASLGSRLRKKSDSFLRRMSPFRTREREKEQPKGYLAEAREV